MVFVTHEMGFARHIADRLLFLEGGHIMEDDTPENVIEHPRNERTKQFFGKILKSNQNSAAGCTQIGKKDYV